MSTVVEVFPSFIYRSSDRIVYYYYIRFECNYCIQQKNDSEQSFDVIINITLKNTFYKTVYITYLPSSISCIVTLLIITPKLRWESFFIECNHWIQIEYNNNTLSCPRTEETMDKFLPQLTYSIPADLSVFLI